MEEITWCEDSDSIVVVVELSVKMRRSMCVAWIYIYCCHVRPPSDLVKSFTSSASDDSWDLIPPLSRVFLPLNRNSSHKSHDEIVIMLTLVNDDMILTSIKVQGMKASYEAAKPLIMVWFNGHFKG